MIWEYCSLFATANRPGLGGQSWDISVAAGGIEARTLHEVKGAREFNRIQYLNLLGLRGWELVEILTDKTVFPGEGIGLKEGNRHSLAYSYRMIFKRPVERPLTESECSALADVGL